MKRRSSFLIATVATVILAVAGGVIVLRKSRTTTIVPAQRYLHQHLPSSEWEPAARLPAGSYKLRQGDSLASIATQRYGHQNYSGVIKLYNHIQDAGAVPAGANLRLPDISNILTEEGFTKVAAPEMEMILCSRAKYDKVKNQLWALRRDRARERVLVPQEIRQQILEASDDLQQATESLKRARPGVSQSPAKMIRQLEDAMSIMRGLAEGANDGYGYDIDMVQQRYGLAITYGIIWAREGFH